MPVLTQNEGVEGDERQEDGIFVYCECYWRNECRHCARNGNEGIWVGGQPTPQHHQETCILQNTNSWSNRSDLLIRQGDDAHYSGRRF